MIHIHKNIFVPFLRHVIFLFSLARFDVTHSPANNHIMPFVVLSFFFLMYVTPYEVCCECTHPTLFHCHSFFHFSVRKRERIFCEGEKELI